MEKGGGREEELVIVSTINARHGDDTIIKIFRTIFHTYQKHWKALGIITMVQLLCCFLLLTLLWIPTYMTLGLAHLYWLPMLSTFLLGSFLRTTNSIWPDLFSYWQQIPNLSDEESFGLSYLLFVILIWNFITSLAVNLFDGAFTYCIANHDVSGVASSIVGKSLQKGRKRMFPAFFFRFLIGLLCLFMFTVTILVPTTISSNNIVVALLCWTIFAIATIVIESFATATIPLIVVRNDSTLTAMQKSWNLALSSRPWFIIKCQFLGRIVFLGTFVAVFSWLLLGFTDNYFILLLCNLILNIFLSSFFPVLSFVLYISLENNARTSYYVEMTRAATIE